MANPGSSLLITLVVKGQLPRKSNSRQLVKNKRTGKPMFIKSDEALQYTEDFLKQIPGEAKQCLGTLERPIRLDAVVYYRSRRPDLSVELLTDLLEKAGVVKNDRYIREQHLWAFVDKNEPRVELCLYSIPANRTIPFTLPIQENDIDV